MTLSIESHVSEVTVFPDRAQVVMIGKSTKLAEGSQTLLVDGLPLALETESVRVAGRGSAEVQILSVDVARAHFVESPAVAVRDLEAQLTSLQDEMLVLDDAFGTWAAEAGYLDGLRQATAEYAKGLSRGRTTVEEQAALLAHIQERDRAVREAQRGIDKQRRDLGRRIDKTVAELNEVRSSRPRQRFQAAVEVTVVKVGEFVLELSYVVGQAGWRPLYDVRLVEDATGSHLLLTTLAQISQRTGQNWEGVALAVSTARPALNQRVPELQPWFIDEDRPRPMPTPRHAKMMTMGRADDAEPMLVSAALMANDVAEVQAEMVSAEMIETGSAVHFMVPGLSDISGDGTPHKTRLNHVKLEPKIDYLTVPRHTTAVFRRATVTVDDAGPLLAGSANLFVGDAFIGKTQIPYTPATGELELLLGAEERITVARELVRRDVDKRLLRDQRQLRFGYEIELKNLLSFAADLVVKDQIPVSRHDQIKVKLEEVKPAPSEKSDLNLLEWRVQLRAGGETKIQYGYLVEHPRELQLAGLQD